MGQGLAAVTGGIKFVLGTPSVWHLALIPVTLMLILFCGLGGLGIWGSSWASEAILGQPDGAWASVGSWVLTVVFALMGLVVALILALALAQPLSGFALEGIALAQEHALTGRNHPQPGFFSALLSSLGVALLTLIVAGFVFGFLFLVDLVFPPALIITVPLKFLLGGWLLAWDFCDYPLGLRGRGFGARLSWVSNHLGTFTAFGLGWALLLMIPGIFLVVLPMGVAGATRLVVADDEPRWVVDGAR